MTGKYLKKSWEGQKFFLLDNGYVVRTEYNCCYGSLVAAIETVEGDILYHCSRGHDAIPENLAWLRDWIHPIAVGHWQHIIRPDFTVIY